ncbi:MAG: pyridoxine 5'-phosphate synthase, partial [bacterium]|nr:pyridoxine 5'-phosphate synthase [bacterium]
SIKAAARGRANVVELDGSDYAKAISKADIDTELDRLEQMAQLVSKLGMSPHCGNGLNYRNIRPLCDLDVFEEFTVGHAVISRAVMVGLDRAVGEMAGIVHAVPGNR